MVILLLFVSVALAGMVIITLSNWLAFPSSQESEMSDGAPSVSVMIPARNEAAVIAEAVRKVLRQTYHRFEFLLLDDHSDDGHSRCGAGKRGIRQPLPYS